MKNLALAIDFNEETDDIVSFAQELAHSTGAALHLVHIFPPEPETIALTPYVYPMPIGIEEVQAHDELIKAEREDLIAIVDRLKSSGLEATGHLKPSQLDIPAAILDFASEEKCELLLIGTHRPGRLERLVLGSTTESIIRKADIPVLVIPRHKE